MKKIYKVLSLLFLILFIVFNLMSYGHSGKTDSQGGHYDHSTGEYHYHHGYPAHQHPNGVCPYTTKTTETEANTSIGKKHSSVSNYKTYILNTVNNKNITRFIKNEQKEETGNTDVALHTF